MRSLVLMHLKNWIGFREWGYSPHPLIPAPPGGGERSQAANRCASETPGYYF